MCITFLYTNPFAESHEYQVILINNRDETYDRPSVTASFWHPNVISARDMTPSKEGGTWLGMSRTGKLGVLFNILEPNAANNKKGRGFIVVDYLMSSQGPHGFCSELLQTSDEYNGFRLLAMQKCEDSANWEMCHLSSNRADHGVERLSQGIYSFGNGPSRSTDWNKVQYGFRRFENELLQTSPTVNNRDRLVEKFLAILKDRTSQFPDGQLQSQAIHLPVVCQEALSSCFVEFPTEFKYGTRTHTIILVDGNNNVEYIENDLQWNGGTNPQWETNEKQFKLCN